MVRTEVKMSMKKKYSACLYFKLLKSYPNKYIYIVQLKEKKQKKQKKTKEEEAQMVVVPFLRNNPSAVMFFQRFIFPAKTLWGKIFGAHLGFSLQVIHSWYSIREKVCNSIFIFRAISLTLVGKPQCFLHFLPCLHMALSDGRCAIFTK
jgi:hypothetical protein